jgi:hypothetical protein
LHSYKIACHKNIGSRIYIATINSKNFIRIEMNELSYNEVIYVSGGKVQLRINLGAFIGGAILGFVTGGPVGLGYAIGAGIVAQGVNSLDDMYRNGEPY